jgi:hypothetical protein
MLTLDKDDYYTLRIAIQIYGCCQVSFQHSKEKKGMLINLI